METRPTSFCIVGRISIPAVRMAQAFMTESQAGCISLLGRARTRHRDAATTAPQSIRNCCGGRGIPMPRSAPQSIRNCYRGRGIPMPRSKSPQNRNAPLRQMRLTSGLACAMIDEIEYRSAMTERSRGTRIPESCGCCDAVFGPPKDIPEP